MSITIPGPIADLIAERRRQDEKWGDQSHHADPLWSVILTEEVGEVARAIFDGSMTDAGHVKEAAHLREELIQVAAVAVAWVEAIDRRGAQA